MYEACIHALEEGAQVSHDYVGMIEIAFYSKYSIWFCTNQWILGGGMSGIQEYLTRTLQIRIIDINLD